MSQGPTIETERLILRRHRLSDYEACCALTTDPEAVRMIYRTPMSPEDTWNRLLRFAGHWSLLGYGLMIVEEKASGQVVGEVGVADFHRGLGDDFDPFPEMAWMMAQDVHGRGYATEAVTAVLGWMQVACRPDQTVCIVDAQNLPSLRVAEKLGYHPIGEAEYKGTPVVKLRRFAPAHG